MPSPDPVVRLLRLMTHFNIGAALATAAWVLWSGAQIVTGQIAPGYRPDEMRRLAQLRSAAHAAEANNQAPRQARLQDTQPPMHLVPVHAARLATQAGDASAAGSPCHAPAAAPVRGAPWREADL